MNAKSNVKSNKTSLQNFKFPNRSEYQAVFFDMDGTLIDSEAMAAQVIMESCREWNVPLVSEDAHAIMGRTWEMAFRYLTQKYTFPLPIDQVSLMMIERYRKLLKKNVKAIAGAVETVQWCAERFPVALISGSHREEILFVLDYLKITPYFKVILGAEDYRESKPSPEGYLKAMSLLGIPHEQANQILIFEDSLAGMTAAKAAGAQVVAVTATHESSLVPVSLEWADYQIKDYTKILEKL